MVTPTGPAGDQAMRDFHFTSQDFARVRRMIYDHAGINLNDSMEQIGRAHV